MVSLTSPQPTFHSQHVYPVLKNISTIQDQFPDLAQFVKENKFEKYMRFFDHHVKIDPKTLEPLLLVKGSMVPWSTAKHEIFGPNLPPSLRLPHGWKYNDQGLVNKNLIKWKKLEPDWNDKIEPKPGHFFIELMCVKKNMWHCWVHLIDDQTRVISAGLCGKVSAWLPLKGKKGKLVSPDPGEFMRGEKMRTRFEITDEQYNQLKTKIENDQAKSVRFNLKKRNCSVYALELLKEIGVNVDNREYLTQALLRSTFSRLQVKPPECVLKALHYIAHFFRTILSPVYHILLLPFGGGLHIKPSALKIATGWKVHAWQEKIAELRAKKILEITNERSQKATISPEETQQFERRILEATYSIPTTKIRPTTIGFSAA